MRVIAGKARHLLLKTIPGLETRPTTDRTKETLFNVINPYIADCTFLDLFSGSGAIGIEALSRGANCAVFVESNHAAINCIKTNLVTTKLEQEAEVLNMEVMSAIGTLENKKKKFDIIFMDPPYDQEIEKSVLIRLLSSSILHEDTIIIVEASKQTKFEYLEGTSFQVYKVKEYKTNKHVFIEFVS